MPNIYLNSSYWGKLTFSKLYFPSLKNSYPCQVLASSNLRWYYWNSKLLLQGFFFRAGAQDGNVIKVARTSCKLKIFYIVSIMLQKLGRRQHLTVLLQMRKQKCVQNNTNETIPRPNNNISDHEASLIQPRTARIP